MTFHLFDAPEREPSQFVGFAGNLIDRQSENRSDASAREALAHSGARLMLVREGRLLLKVAGGGRDGDDLGYDPYFTASEAETLKAGLDGAVLLGFFNGAPFLAASGGLAVEELPETVKAIDYRSVYVQGLLPAADLGAMAQGAALLAWHASHGFCGKCGHATEVRAGGYKRHCPACSTEHFPRTDPVAIMLAVTRDRCLLGRGKHFPPGMYSALAGFIEPGETIEAAVRRETMEEAGIRLGRVVYHASQPWPFPYSLMIGCFGEALNEDISPDVTELEDVRWFTRDDVFAAMEKRHPSGIFIPPNGAIAHHLIRFWAENS
jgi:NAD+ diphosphatase